MANELLNLVWPLQLESSGEKFVLVALADAANADGWCSMCVDTIAYRTGLTARYVTSTLKAICEKGLIFINERRGRSSEFMVNKVALETWQKAATWLKNQKLKEERIEKIKAQMQAAAPAQAPVPAQTNSTQDATKNLLLEREQQLKKSVPVPKEIADRWVELRRALVGKTMSG